MTATPTPGDLSALRERIEGALAYAGSMDHDTFVLTLRGLRNDVAALSALPAAGGAVETIHIEVRECDCGHVGINDCSDTNGACHDCEWQGPDPKEDLCPGCGHKNCMGAACPKCGSLYRLIAEKEIATTPQPSAAEGAAVGEQGDGWIERVRAWANTLQSADRTTLHRLLDELTGPAQGDGWQDKVLEILRPLLDTGDSRTADDKAVAIYAILADATPAAGKGVDDAWKEAVLDELAVTHMDAAQDEPPAKILARIIEWHLDVVRDFRAGHEKWEAANASLCAERHGDVSALTRQPVAGDGMVLAEGWYHFLKGEDGDPDDYELFDLVSNPTAPCPKCLRVQIVRAPAATPTDGGEG